MNFSLQKFIIAYSVGVVKSACVNRVFFQWQNWDVSTQTMSDSRLMIVHLLQPFRDALYSNAQPWKIPKAMPGFSQVGWMDAALWCGRSCDWMVVFVLPITNSISLWFVAICGKTFNFWAVNVTVHTISCSFSSSSLASTSDTHRSMEQQTFFCCIAVEWEPGVKQ